MALWCLEINAIVICVIIDDLLGHTAICSVGLARNFLSFQSDWDGRLLIRSLHFFILFLHISFWATEEKLKGS